MRTPSATSMGALDSHQHFWVRAGGAYAWLDSAPQALNDDFDPVELGDAARAAGITHTVLVQSDNTYRDTNYMLEVAQSCASVVGVVAWLPLDRPEDIGPAVESYSRSELVCGVRTIPSDGGDAQWALTRSVDESLKVLASSQLAFDYVADTQLSLESVATIAERHPSLTIVIDHLGSPLISTRGWEPWASTIQEAATHPNVFAKISGLSTLSDSDGWASSDWTPYLCHALEVFGSERLMLGSDWPVSILGGTLETVWSAQVDALPALSAAQMEDLLVRSARRAYSIGDPEFRTRGVA